MNKISLQDCLSCVIDNRGVTPHKRSIEWATKGVPVLSANNVKTSGLCDLNSIRFIPSDAYSSWMKIPLEQGDLILTSEAPAGEVLYWDSDEKVVLGQRLFGLKVREGVDAKYLKYYLQSPLGQKAIRNQQSGSTVFGIAASTFSQIAVFLPSDQRQKTSSNLLYALDKAIENNSSICSDLEAAAKLLYDYWFVQFDFPDENGKPYKSSGGKMVWNDELKREIPAGWTCVQLGSIAEYVGDSISNDLLDSSSYISTDNMVSNRGGVVQSQFVPEIGSSTKFQPGDILLSNIRPYFKKIWCADRIGGCCNDVLVLRPILRDYAMLCYWTMRSDSFFAYDMAGSKGSKMPRGDKNHILQYPIALPPKNEKIAVDFDKIANLVEINVSRLRADNSQLVELRDFLLPLLMNGQVTIGDDGK